MEVHHHPRVEKKEIKEFFFGILNDILAVTLGFFLPLLVFQIAKVPLLVLSEG